MITEDYVSFEIAKLLKDKGFDEFTFSDYNENGIAQFNEVETRVAKGYQRPTLQMAMKWLREMHHIFITIEIKGDPRKEDFIYYKWSVAKYCSIKIDRIDNNLTCPEDYWIAPDEEEETYERTCEAALKYCLENLI